MKLGIITDIHEDYLNLTRAVSLFEHNNCDEIVCLGDIVGFSLPHHKNVYHKDANLCVDLVRNVCAVVVVGNHDLFAVGRIPCFETSFPYTPQWSRFDEFERKIHIKNNTWFYSESDIPSHLTDENRDYLLSLPESIIKSYGSTRLLFSHFFYPDLPGNTKFFPRKVSDLKEHFEYSKDNKINVSFLGHGHIEGALMFTATQRLHLKFGQYQIRTPLSPRENGHQLEQISIVCPSIARTRRKNGVLIFDIDSAQLEIIPLKDN